MDTADLAVIGLVGLLGVGGAFAYREYDRRRDELAGNRAASGQLTGGTGNHLDDLLPAGSTAPLSGTDPATQAANQRAAEQRRQDDLLRQQRIDTLRRDLARIQNDIDVLVVQANAIRAKPIDPAFEKATVDKVWADCKAQHRFFPTTACLQAGTSEKAAAAVRPAWDARLALELQPLQAQLSRLNSEQLATVDNLRALGFTVQAAEVRKVTI